MRGDLSIPIRSRGRAARRGHVDGPPSARGGSLLRLPSSRWPCSFRHEDDRARRGLPSAVCCSADAKPRVLTRVVWIAEARDRWAAGAGEHRVGDRGEDLVVGKPALPEHPPRTNRPAALSGYDPRQAMDVMRGAVPHVVRDREAPRKQRDPEKAARNPDAWARAGPRTRSGLPDLAMRQDSRVKRDRVGYDGARRRTTSAPNRPPKSSWSPRAANSWMWRPSAGSTIA